MGIAVIAAAGSGQRLGAGLLPKALLEVAGRPMLAWSLAALERAREVDRVAVAAPPGHEARVEEIAAEATPSLAVSVVTGGASRSESVLRAIGAFEGADSIAVHDAARPLAPPELFDRCFTELREARCDAVVAAAPVNDTIKQADRERRVTRTLDRSDLWAVQTPQVFRATALVAALTSAPDLAAATDDAQLVEQAGGEVRIVEAPPHNIKVTTTEDLRLAELLLRPSDLPG